MQATLGTRAHLPAYDAWNRLVAVWVDDGDGTREPATEDIATYQYDGLGRRIVRTDCTPATDVVYHDYYTPSWQLIEVRKDGQAAADLHKQYVWGLRYIDAPVLRDRETDGGSAGLDERLYYTQDGNFNVTALVNPEGEVVERYSYDAYGQVTVRNGAENVDPDTVNDPATQWDPDPDNASDVDNRLLYCGYRFDAETGLYHVRHRYLHPTLGRWTTRDPLGYVDGMGLYEYVGNSPLVAVDPRGMELIKRSTIKGWIAHHIRMQKELSVKLFLREHQLTILKQKNEGTAVTLSDLKSDTRYMALLGEYARHSDAAEHDESQLLPKMCEAKGDRSGRWLKLVLTGSNWKNPDDWEAAAQTVAVAGVVAAVYQVSPLGPQKTIGAKTAAAVGNVAINLALPSPIEAGLHILTIGRANTNKYQWMWLKVQCVKCSCKSRGGQEFLMWEDKGDPEWVLLDTYKEGIQPGSARLRNTDAVYHDAKITEAVVQKIKQTCTISFGK